MSTISWLRRAAWVALLSLAACFGVLRPATAQDVAPWPASSVVYCVYPSIFSPQRNFAGVTAQLGRLKTLGVTVVWLMPVTPVGQAVNGHPSFGSPYAVQDYSAVNPGYGTEADLRTLVTTAHGLGLKVILDEVLNHTSWDNPLLMQHPDYYVHGDGNPNNPASIQQALSYPDVAQLNYANPALRAYVTEMLRSWITRYGVDGFRFDSASNPNGPGRLIPADFWQELGRQLRAAKPDVLLLGESETPDLALKPFTLDYGWWVYDALRDASNGGDAARVQAAWQSQTDRFPPGMAHLSLGDNWDKPRDVSAFGGQAGAMAAAVFNFTSTGVPLLYNGMEIGNAGGAVNPHTPIDWSGGDSRFPPFYRQLLALRRSNLALQQGTMTWLPNSAPAQVLTYERVGGGSTFLLEINVSPTAAQGTATSPVGSGWTEVPLAQTRGAPSPVVPERFSLPPHGFAIFRRALSK